ncbi:MAG TPA: threonine--tRNA ligase [Rickettsia endosymbiont of Proechinophthirus fluctus]|uniref:threonine--tRNA ligase n=1 Tax=Rickettsia endosymbiont of Proechinophthirus fluctus TaxID=1462733 RepID=UPI000789FB3D|nr:threonine--tRNA ligase [Rickettsia endosymbiont of Proechinophthirus fluctus]KYP97878.1 threonyl-tRNA synthetase [Rickettsia endosymbiont of Proechinophthirus fluctus]HJD54259.1 threonine--tRNA ligase [Rickettsia endosymbiont of Proechinophthirus fluctus]
MINISFPDGSIKQFAKNITAYEVANAISMSLAKAAMVAEINGELQDLSIVIDNDCKLRILTAKDPECLEIIRHDAAHLTAEAVKELFPETQVTIGPAIENGYYYDFARDKPFTNDDLAVIEAKMQELSQKNEQVTRELWDRDKAVEFFKSIGEHYKAEIIASISAGEPITLYRQGNFIDLCRGPHAPSTGVVKHFKLMKVAGAYWRGDSRNEMLQRIYGTAWATKEQLDSYLLMLEEAEKRDHRKLGRELDLFHFQEEAQGMVFWHDKGWSIYNTIEQYIRKKIRKNGYTEVKTPVLVDKSLWEASGHWEKFRDDMFALETDDKTLALKPMNCPCHVQIFKQGIKSYRDLPLRMSEFGLCHRNEASGALHGLMRVRSLVQDDAHIFCTAEQITDETSSFCKLLTEVYKDFGFTDIKVKFSDRPEIRAGRNEVWDKAENALKEAVEQAGFTYTLNPGEGAFYGPKLEFVLTDAIGRQWQCGTLQMDFVLPERLDASYVAASGEKKRPVMLHRAILGSLERFIGILIEEYAGRFPLWLAPVQVAIATITSDLNDYALEVRKALIDNGVRTDFNISPDKIHYKIREFSNQKIPMIAVIGKQEQENKQVAIRRLGTTDQEVLSVEQLIAVVKEENEKYL